jgi:hypothetical protein
VGGEGGGRAEGNWRPVFDGGPPPGPVRAGAGAAQRPRRGLGRRRSGVVNHPRRTAGPVRAAAEGDQPERDGVGDSVPAGALADGRRTRPMGDAQSQPIPLAAISPSSTNPRRVFKDLDQLGASINAVGVLQPILVRPWPATRGLRSFRATDSPIPITYEIVAGERRWRACAEHTQLTEIPAVVRDLTDVEALEIQAHRERAAGRRAPVRTRGRVPVAHRRRPDPGRADRRHAGQVAGARPIHPGAAHLPRRPGGGVDSPALVPPTVAQLVCRSRTRSNATRRPGASWPGARTRGPVHPPGAGAGAYMG